MESSAELEQALRALVSSGPVEVRENGQWFAALSEGQWEVRGQPGRILLHVWSSERNLVRRVLRIASSSDDSLLLDVERFGRAKPDRLEISRVNLAKPERSASRQTFRAWFHQLLTEQFPDEELSSLSIASDLEHSLSQCYARGVMRRGRQAWAVVGVSSGESPATRENILPSGLLWLERLRNRAKREAVSGLRLLVPQGSARVTLHRLGALNSSIAVELYEYEERRATIRRLDRRDSGNIDSWLVPRREMEALLERAAPELDPLLALAPREIAAAVVAGTRQVSMRFRGIEFACWEDGKVFFGIGDRRKELIRTNADALRSLVSELEAYRHPAASDLRHPLYRAQPERWLQTLAQQDITRIDPRLDPAYLYPQVPALSAGDRGVLDLLGVTRDGRLAIVELKAQEDPQLLFQAVDYWLRIRWHQQQDDFARYGYFPGVKLQAAPPLLFLVAPGLRFHPATDILLKSLSPDIEVIRVGLAENWRRSLRVIFRQ